MSASTPSLAAGNRLLASLAVIACGNAAWLATRLELALLDTGEVIGAVGEHCAHAYSPETAVLSVIARIADGAAVEVGRARTRPATAVRAWTCGARAGC